MPEAAKSPAGQLLFETNPGGLRLLHCGRYPCRPDWQIKASRVPPDMMGFLFVEKNACWSRVNNGRRLVFNEGDLRIVPGGAEFDMGHDPAKPITALSLTVAWENGAFANILSQRRFAQRYRLRDTAAYVACFDALLEALSSPLAVRDLLAGAALMRWIAHILLATGAPLKAQFVTGQSPVEKILAAQSWAMAHLPENLMLDHWAKATGWHPYYFERVFKRETGLAPMRWLEERRMEAARRYLSVTGQTVTEIALAVGYEDPFYFSRVFRKYFGHPPLRYRQSAISGTAS